MKFPAFNDRVEIKYQIGIHESEVAELWRELTRLLKPFGLDPVQEITSVGSVYFDNRDCDLLRFSLLGHLMIFRTRAYEAFGRVPDPITKYWVEVKTAQGIRRKKKRFPLTKSELIRFLSREHFDERPSNGNFPLVQSKIDPELYRESRETLLTMGLNPMLLVVCKRVAFQGPADRLSIDWDVQYFPATADVYNSSSWKYLTEPAAGRAGKVILEIKTLTGDRMPPWLSELQRRYPIREREYLKPVEGMGFLFKGPLRAHTQADYFIPRIDAYMENSLLG
jgi:SPX domain protein involved in polyphosphate accumulation